MVAIMSYVSQNILRSLTDEESKSTSNPTIEVINQVKNYGFVHIKPEYYINSKINLDLIEDMQEKYANLSKDSSPGNRFRAYACYDWLPNEQKFVKQNTTHYFQSKEYNYDDGGKVRLFDPIVEAYLNNPVLKTLIEKDVELAKQTGIIDFESEFQMGFHQIRYKAQGTEPSYSSPVWLHRDDEPLVFVHLFNLSKNVLGGDNLIATDPKTITHIFRLNSPLETLLLTKMPYHAVTPLGSSNGDNAFRDILLITFMNKK
uniref:Prolyl 4-hydroxylase alpha subunit Fe(2+) 2OG dioxygenase domain-containing protein n=1 Tax=Panagrolaimus superbus TaxID=310955 RepID=A0A914YNT5_9BILA